MVSDGLACPGGLALPSFLSLPVPRLSSRDPARERGMRIIRFACGLVTGAATAAVAAAAGAAAKLGPPPACAEAVI